MLSTTSVTAAIPVAVTESQQESSLAMTVAATQVARVTKLHDFGAAGVSVSELNSNSRMDLFTVTNSQTHDVQLWGSNGTSAGTLLLHEFGTANVRLYANGASPSDSSAVIFFEVLNATSTDAQLWGTNGTTVGTRLLHDFQLGAPKGEVLLIDLGAPDGIETFFVDREAIGSFTLSTSSVQIWSSDGTEVGTSLLHDFSLNLPPNSSGGSSGGSGGGSSGGSSSGGGGQILLSRRVNSCHDDLHGRCVY